MTDWTGHNPGSGFRHMEAEARAWRRERRMEAYREYVLPEAACRDAETDDSGEEE